MQFVANTWGMTADLRAQALRSKGFLVLKVDNRGSNRSLDSKQQQCVKCSVSLELSASFRKGA